jgi:ABC-type lipoprotein export system ATPase subunit
MSEEILRALMELFALIVKQDAGMLQGERDYVSAFLQKQLTHQSADEFMTLFLENAGPMAVKDGKTEPGTASVRDSIRIFHNCTKINRTLTQEQRVIVLMRCFELISTDGQYTPQRMNIINTIAEVFKISREEFTAISLFVRKNQPEAFNDPSMLVVNTGHPSETEGKGPFVVFLKIASVNLYFLRCFCSDTTLLNGLPISRGKVHAFAPGSSVHTPPAAILYYSDITSRFMEDKDIHRITLVADHLNHRFSDGTPAITDLSFSAREGNLVAIMGASGSGKTTLLNLLTGLIKPDAGEVRINGIPITGGKDKLDGVIGYVPQDDLLVEDLTVFQNLWYAAALCFAGRTDKELTAVVNGTLQTLGLYEKRNLRVGSPLDKVISGGQRKRLNIALELIREPSLLFLD